MLKKFFSLYKTPCFMRLLKIGFGIILFLGLSSCHYPVKTTKKLDESTRVEHLITQPIYFHIKADQEPKSSAYFLLMYNMNSNKYYLKLKWLLYSNQRPFINMTNSLKLNLDDQIELLLSAMKPPRVTKFTLEPRGAEEEVVFEIDRTTLEIMTNASKIDLVVNARTLKLKGYFIGKHSFNAIKEFLGYVDQEIRNQ